MELSLRCQDQRGKANRDEVQVGADVNECAKVGDGGWPCFNAVGDGVSLSTTCWSYRQARQPGSTRFFNTTMRCCHFDMCVNHT